MTLLINKSQSHLIIRFNTGDIVKTYDNINLILDIDPVNGNPSGIEIINLAEQMKGAKFLLPDSKNEHNGVFWSTSYDEDNDVAYIGFVQKDHSAPFKTKMAKGRVLLNQEGLVLGIDVDLKKVR